MKHRRLARKNASVSSTAYEAIYGREVQARIRRKYSLGAELAILRQRDEKPEEFAAYHAYAEKCKAEAKVDLSDSEEENS